MSSRISSAPACQRARELGVPAPLGEARAAVERDPAHQLRGDVVARLPARLPDPLVGLAPHAPGPRNLVGEHRPQAVVDVVVALGVQVHGVQHRAEDVVLALAVGAVAAAAPVASSHSPQLADRDLAQIALAADAVHDLQAAVLVARQVGEVLHEVVRLPVEVERVQAPQRERRVAHPAVAVVPVALAARGLGQRCRQRRDHRAGRRIGQPLQHERGPLQVPAPRMVGVGAGGQPLAPVVAGAGDLGARLLDRGRAVEAADHDSAQKRRSPSRIV